MKVGLLNRVTALGFYPDKAGIVVLLKIFKTPLF
jgi:hypothetical protein